jgi:hypothetical protein
MKNTADAKDKILSVELFSFIRYILILLQNLSLWTVMAAARN